MYYGSVGLGVVTQIALTPNREWMYGIGMDSRLWYQNMAIPQWVQQPFDCQQVEIDPTYKKWFRHNNVIKDEADQSYSAADCLSFVVDDEFLGCRKQNKDVYIRSKVFEKSSKVNFCLQLDPSSL